LWIAKPEAIAIFSANAEHTAATSKANFSHVTCDRTAFRRLNAPIDPLCQSIDTARYSGDTKLKSVGAVASTNDAIELKGRRISDRGVLAQYRIALSPQVPPLAI